MQPWYLASAMSCSSSSSNSVLLRHAHTNTTFCGTVCAVTVPWKAALARRSRNAASTPSMGVTCRMVCILSACSHAFTGASASANLSANAKASVSARACANVGVFARTGREGREGWRRERERERERQRTCVLWGKAEGCTHHSQSPLPY